MEKIVKQMTLLSLAIAFLIIITGCSETQCPVPRKCEISLNVLTEPKPIAIPYEVKTDNQGNYFIDKQNALIMKYNWLSYKIWAESQEKELQDINTSLLLFNK